MADSRPPDPLDVLARALIDGFPVDWPREADGAPDADREAVLQMQILSRIAALHGSDTGLPVLPGRAPSGDSTWLPWPEGTPLPLASVEEPLAPVIERWLGFELLEVIDRGASSQVYRARDTNLNREVALRLIDDVDASRSDETLADARRLAQVRHDHVVTVYGADRAEGRIGIWMELINGRTLAAQVTEHGPYNAVEAAAIGRDVCRALTAVDQVGLSQRNADPRHIIREQGGRLVLMYGGGDRDASFDAPEVRAGQTPGARSDVFSVGRLLFALVTGAAADRQADHAGAMPTLRDLRPDLPPAFAQVIERACDHDGSARVASPAALERALQAALTSTEVSNLRRRLWLAAAAALVLASIAAWVITWTLTRPAVQGGTVRFEIVAPTGYIRRAATAPAFAVSPDGQTVLYEAWTRAGGRGVSYLFTRRLDQTDSELVPNSENGASALAWSPDSKSIGFGREGGIYRYEIGTREPRRLCDVPGGAGVLSNGASWGTNGDILFGVRGQGIFRVSDKGGEPTQVTSIDAAQNEEVHAEPWFLPDGRHFLFLALEKGRNRGVIWVSSTNDPSRTRITESTGGAAAANGWLLTSSGNPRMVLAQRFDAARLALSGAPIVVDGPLGISTTNGWSTFSVSANGVLILQRFPYVLRQLTWVDRAGRILSRVGLPAAVQAFALAPNHQRVAYTITDAGQQPALWATGGPATGAGTQLVPNRTPGVYRPLWDPSGERIFFTAQGLPTGPELRVIALDGSPTQILESMGTGGLAFYEDWSRDGRQLLLNSSGGIFVQPGLDPSKRRRLIESRFSALMPRFAPNGRWVAFGLMLPRGADIFVESLEHPGDRLQITKDGGGSPVWSDDSRELYFEDDTSVKAVAISEREGHLVAGTPQTLFPVHTQGLIANQPHNVEVADNGQRFLISAIVGDSDNLRIDVVLNWASSIARLTAATPDRAAAATSGSR